MSKPVAVLVVGLLLLVGGFLTGVEHAPDTRVDGRTVGCGRALPISWLDQGAPAPVTEQAD